MVKSKEDLKPFSRALLFQVIVIGILWASDTTFFFFEQNFFNTYLDHVLGLSGLYISLMVSLSAVTGLIMNFVWGIISDNTRSKYGRRRPFFLFALIAGVSMILFAVFENYWICVFIDVVLIGITSNAVSVAQRAVIPDTVDLERRGRANGIVQAVSYIGLIIALAFFLLGTELFGVPDPEGDGTIITQTGHFIMLSIGGIFYALCGIIGFAFIREQNLDSLGPKKKFANELKELVDINLLREQKNFLKVVLAATIFNSGINTIMPFLFIYILGLPLGIINLLIAILVGFLVLFPSVVLMGRAADKFGRKKFLPLIFVVVSLAFMIVPFVYVNGVMNFILFVILIPFILIGLLGVNTIIHAWAQDTLPEGKRGQFYGIFNIVLTVSQIIGSTVGGLVSDIFGIASIFVFGALFMLLSIPFFIIVKETLEFGKSSEEKTIEAQL